MKSIRETLLSRVVHCRRDPYDIYIGRGSPWGNPFKIGKDGSRLEVIDKYLHYFLKHPCLLRDLYLLENQVLGCYCSPKFCHGHILVALTFDLHDCPWCGERHIGGPEFCKA